MSSSIDICNLALSRLAAARITSFDDNTIESKECKAVYDLITKQVQSKGPWMCQKLRTSLPQLDTSPNFGYAYAYQLPISPLCLRVLKINEDTVGDNNYQIENNLLYTDNATVSILYMGLISDPNQYDPYLEESVIDHLVAQMAYKFTGSMDVAEKALQYAKQNSLELLNLSSLQGSNDYLPSAEFTDIRFADTGDNNANPIVHQ